MNKKEYRIFSSENIPMNISVGYLLPEVYSSKKEVSKALKQLRQYANKNNHKIVYWISDGNDQ
jgi:hypothetical protein